MKQERQNNKLDYVVRIDLCIDIVLIILGIIALLYFRGRYLEIYRYLENMNEFLAGQMLMFVVLVVLSIVTNIKYIVSKKATFGVKRYVVIWIILKIINIIFFLLSLLLVI